MYFKEFTLREFCNAISEEFGINENASSDLTKLTDVANDVVFKRFNIKPSDKVYFISGSARLYLSEGIRKLFNLTKPVGDLDIVIPDKQIWIDAGLEEEYNRGVFKPVDDGSIEVFHVWDPSLGGDDAYAHVKVRSESEIMNDLTQQGGYWFMSLYDVIDYKISLNRDKERDIVQLIGNYSEAMKSGDKKLKMNILKKIITGLGREEANKFFARIGSEIEVGNRRVREEE